MFIKRTIFTAAFGLLAFSAMAQNGYSLKGKFTGNHNGQKVILSYRYAGKEVRDSAVVKNGGFMLKGKVNDVVKATITLKALKEDNSLSEIESMLAVDEQVFFLENKPFILNGPNASKAVIKGGEAQTDYLLLKSNSEPFQSRMDSLSRLVFQYHLAKNEEARIALIPRLDPILKELIRIKDAFIYQYPDSYVSLSMVETKGSIIDVKKFEPFFTALSPRMKNTAKGMELAARLKSAKRTGIGQPAIDFVQDDAKGKPVSLTALKGKYVLLDFWASWCVPCRAENPNVLKAYERFKDKNFEIIAVSLDSKKEPWLEAIETDGLPWIHVIDLKGSKNSIVAMYDIKAVPQNFLIGPDGVILAKNLRGKELEKKLAELIDIK